MHATLVIAHPDPASLTHALAQKVRQGVEQGGNSIELVDLAAENFDPRFDRSDLAVHLSPTHFVSELRSDLCTHQKRLDRSDALILVYPVYWWSMPALMKGWIDRVFTNGWAYGADQEGRLVKKLRHLKVHLLALGGADNDSFDRRGYRSAMATQIEHGIFDYCGAEPVQSLLLTDAHKLDPTPYLDRAYAFGQAVFAHRAIAG